MRRRAFGALTLAAISGHAVTGKSSLAAEANLDRFGGWSGKRFKATGFFRVEKDERWWLVTPEGNSFLSFGINHLHSDLWRQEFNRDTWKSKLQVADFDDWPKFNSGLRSWFLDVCKRWGFNTAGVHTSLNVINKPKPEMAYMQPIKFVDIPHWKTEVPDSNFVDVFAEEFASHCDSLAKELVAPDDPYLLGYTMTDCPLLTEEDCRERPDVIGGARREARIGWPRRLRNLGAAEPGKVAYIESMKQIYQDRIRDFNQTYSTKFDSFDALAQAENWRPETDLANANEMRDNLSFLHRVVDQYYKTARDAIVRHDPNHMFIGDKLNANTDSIDTVLPVTSQYTDIVMYQMYGRYEVQKPGLDRWAKATGKPFINGDSAFTMVTDSMPRPYGPVADSLEQRAQWTTEFFLRAFERSDFVGWHYCGLIDATQKIARKQARQHSGLLNEYGEPYQELFKAIRRCADELYDVANG